MDANSSITITFLIAVVGFLFTVYNFYASRKKEALESNQRLEEIRESLLKCNMKLDQVCATTNETRSDIKFLNTRIQEIDKELSIVKRDLNIAFTQINEIKESQNG